MAWSTRQTKAHGDLDEGRGDRRVERGRHRPREHWRRGQDVNGDKSETRVRAVAARRNYLGQDRMDMQYAAKEVSSFMSEPAAS